MGHQSSGVPLVLLHGGPGIPGVTFTGLMTQLAPERPVIRYDQLGCGRSDRPTDSSLWRIETFLEELAAVREQLQLRELHLLGHSWGGMLAIEYLLTRPVGVRSLILTSSLCNTPFWIKEARQLRTTLPPHICAVMRRFEDGYRANTEAATTPADRVTRPGIAPEEVRSGARIMRSSLPLVASAGMQRVASWLSFIPLFRRAAYEIAGAAFLRRHVCRLDKVPLALCQAYLTRNQQVYEAMWGPSEFFATGTLADWNVEDRLHEITVPTLILSGRYDEATPAQQQRLHDGIAGSRWRVFENSAHFSFLEEPALYCEVVAAFLDEIEAGVSARGPR